MSNGEPFAIVSLAVTAIGVAMMIGLCFGMSVAGDSNEHNNLDD